MRELLLIRHGRTGWNAQRRLQGHADLPLDAVGEADTRAWRVPGLSGEARWLCSPLSRARRTASNLLASHGGKSGPGDRKLIADPRLIEMHWGRWEGRRLRELRAELGAALQVNEARGLDFRPCGGECPREVCARLADLCRDLAAGYPGGDAAQVVAVTHKGVIRAALALATGWDMRGRPPLKLRWDAAHLFQIHGAGQLKLVAPNLCLIPAPAAACLAPAAAHAAPQASGTPLDGSGS